MTQEFTHGFALVVGVKTEYPQTVNDANAVADILTDPGRCADPADQVHLLFDFFWVRSRELE